MKTWPMSIRAGGLAEIKARRIKETLLRIKQDAGAISLCFLADMGKEEAMAVSAIPARRRAQDGVRGAPLRLRYAISCLWTRTSIASRDGWGWWPEDVKPEKAQPILEGIVPAEKYLSLHLNLIKHGRLICRARGPRHEECALRNCCDCYLQGQKP